MWGHPPGGTTLISFLGLYHGPNLETAELLAVSIDPQVVSGVATAVLRKIDEKPAADPALRAIQSGRRRALRLVAEGAPPVTRDDVSQLASLTTELMQIVEHFNSQI
jgi:hypothetical protein